MSELQSRSESFRDVLRREAFQRELHHLLWMKPVTVRGQYDPGWSCRDHVFLIGGMALLRGLSVIAVRGRAGFICGVREGSVPSGYDIQPHWWLSVEGIGDCDLSPRLDLRSDSMAWPSAGPTGLIGGEFLPGHAVHCASLDSDRELEQALAQAATRDGSLFACYHPAHWEVFNEATLNSAFKWSDSPLSVHLLKANIRKGDLYAKAVLFLDEFARDETGSLVGLSQLQAWKQIAARPGNGRLELMKRLHQALVQSG